jgi:hypothetical protein
MRLSSFSIALIVVLSGCATSKLASRHRSATPRPTKDGLRYVVPGATSPGGKPRPTANAHVTAPIPASLKTATPSAPARLSAGAYNAHVFGTVTNTARHPIAGALVEVTDGQRTTHTDAAGHYSIAFPSKAIVSLQVRKSGFQCGMAMSTGTIKSGQNVRKDWSCTPVVRKHPAPPPFPSFVGTPAPGMKAP